jgi:regulator of sigma E protease
MNPASQPGAGRGDMTDAEYAQTFQSKALWQRALIVFAGPAVNFILAILIFMGFLLSFGQAYTPPVAGQIVEGSAAAKAGLLAGDRVIAFNGTKIETFEALVNEVVMIPNEQATILLNRNGQQIEKQVNVAERRDIDRFGNEYRIGQIGVGAVEPARREVGILESPWVAVKQTVAILRQQIQGIGQIITGRRSVKELGGPLKIAKISGEVWTLGILSFISLAALISINLGFMNLLPIPMLDGGHLFLYAIEAVRKRPASPMVQEWAFRVGFAMVVGFMLMVTFNDLESFGLFG